MSSPEPPAGFVPEDAATFDRIQTELYLAAAVLDGIAPAVTIFGSARSSPKSPEYQNARTLGGLLARVGVPVITGGGPGVMEAANRGASEAGGESVGLNINLPREQTANDYLTRVANFRYFLTRKFMLTRYSLGFVVYPGGFGTADELFELLVLYNTDRTERRPIVLVDRGFWSGLIEWVMNYQGAAGYIDPVDVGYVQLVDTPEAALVALVGSARAGLAMAAGDPGVAAGGDRPE